MNNPIAERAITGDVTDQESDAQALTRFLREHVGALLSPKIGPLPPCHRCKSEDVRWECTHEKRAGPLPQFLCRTCARVFNRLSGTPLTR
jgi:hypothetical protein